MVPFRSGTLALGALFCGALAIGCSPIFMRLSDIGPVSTAAFRMLFALPLLYAWQAVSDDSRSAGRSREKRGTGSRTIAVFIVPAFFFAGDLALWHFSVNRTSIANAALLTNLAPVFVAVWGRLFFNETFSRTFLAGMCLALTGSVLLMGQSVSFNRAQWPGDLSAMLSAVFYAGYLLSLARLRKAFSTVRIMFWSSLFTTILLLALAWSMEGAPGKLTWETILVIVALATICHVIGQGFIIYSLAHLPVIFSSVSLLLQPVFAGGLAWVIFGEALQGGQVLGGILILAGIAAVKIGMDVKKDS